MALSRTLARLSCAAALMAGVTVAMPVHAMTAKECRAAFASAKAGGTLNGQAYKAYKAAHCGDATSPATAAAPAAPAAPGAPATPAKAPVAASGNVVFPTAISPEFSKLSAGRARQKTCVAQYNANKATGGNGSLKWIQRGGGYWSECNTHLKGAQ